jgi:formate/nitrite transporter FocA (FNT family)
MYFIPLGILLEDGGAIAVDGLFHNLLPVTLGNIAGGAGLVGMVYWVIYHQTGDPGPG